MCANRSKGTLCGIILSVVLGNAAIAADLHPVYPLVGATVGTPYPYELDLARDPSDVPGVPLADGATVVITAHEVESYISPKLPAANWAGDGTDVAFQFFAFGGGHEGQELEPRVPGPFIRLRQGRTVTVKLENYGKRQHSLDFHAVLGKTGGAGVLTAAPGGEASFTFTAKKPGIYVYHCVGNGTPHEVAHHINNGMYGLILVEPARRTAFRHVQHHAREFYIFQNDVYYDAETRSFDEHGMLSTMVPDYVTFNGRIGSLVDRPPMATKGQNAMIYFGNTGGHISSFHIVGEILDWVWNLGDLTSKPLRNVQTVPVASASAVAIGISGKTMVPTDLAGGDINIMLDHGSPYFRKGALGLFLVEDHK
ncbi:MAG: multicopper oxidase domain-containing protein [Gammaproteobacteria bacterium]|nr:multicopper oxidase domain-containing protein [Gammaproteobacteria bacterium]